MKTQMLYYTCVILYTYFMDARWTVKTVSQGIRDDFGTIGLGQQFQMSALIPRDNSFDCSPSIHEISVLLPDQISNIEITAN